ncbi:MAG: hypothetical protein HQ481_00875 [Alphaproteobacteria bacterium]|nr:hypothetical protein [Alphaproteobacteria bacterium]
MLDVPGPHFALSELLIVVAAIVCCVIFGRAGLLLAAVGALLFGVIAAIGVQGGDKTSHWSAGVVLSVAA